MITLSLYNFYRGITFQQLFSTFDFQFRQVRQCILRALSHAGPSAAQPCVAAMEPRLHQQTTTTI